MSDINTLGIDLAKNDFQLHGVDQLGHCVLKKKVKRHKLPGLIANLKPCTIAMEACGGANYWARQFAKHGHEVRLIAPQFVKPYVKSNKNDAHDAAAICEASSRPSMRFVPVKTVSDQDIQMLHRMRSQAVKQKTALSNQMRGFLLEYGITLPKGFCHVRNLVPGYLEDANNELTDCSRALLNQLLEEFRRLEQRVKDYDEQVNNHVKSSDTCQRLMKVEGIGPLSASIIACTIIQPQLFKNGRELAAWLGLVPKQHSSGGRSLLQGISKRGDRYLRTLLIHGGRTVVKVAQAKKTSRQQKITQQLQRIGYNRTAVAVANKNARIIWALLARNDSYRPDDFIGATA